MNLGISRKKYDPCKMETILFHKEEWKMNESNWWTTSWNNMEIEFPLIYLLHLLLTNILINIYIYFTRSRRGYDRWIVWGDISFSSGNHMEYTEEKRGETIETELWIKWTSERKWLNEMFDIPLVRKAGVFERSATNLPETEKRILINIGG